MSFEDGGFEDSVGFNPDDADYSDPDGDGFDVEESLEAKEQKLKELLENFDVPPTRLEIKDWKWMNRNLGIKLENRENSDYEEVVGLLKEILGDEFIDEVM